MSTLASFSVKQQDGMYKNYTVSISDTADKYNNNVSVYEEQTKEERDAKVKKTYLGNGRVFWTDGKPVFKPEPKAKVEPTIIENTNEVENDLPF